MFHVRTHVQGQRHAGVHQTFPALDGEGARVFYEGDKQPSRFTYQDLTSEQHNEALTAAFKEKPIKGFDRMVEELTQAYADIGFKRGRSVIIKMLKYLINEQKLIVKRDNHYYFGYTPVSYTHLGSLY